MITRFTVIVLLSSLLAACANETTPFAGLAPTSALAIAPPPQDLGANMSAPQEKTLSDRVLAAMALERVTGMKPDPARFVH
ncbi:MAG: hypothetical protein R3D67_16185 [Hyphomicrobiaceae bacterium]